MLLQVGLAAAVELLDGGGSRLGGLLGELLAVTDVPLGEEVVLDPDHLVDGLDHGYPLGHGESMVGEDALDEDGLDEAERGADVDVFDVKGVLPS